MKLNKSQKELLNEILAMAKYINVYQEIETLLKKGEQPNWSEIESKYKITARQCYEILTEVKKDIQEELTNKIEIENKARTEQRKLDENYIESLKRYNDRNHNKVD
jgi:hypothetical protein